MNRPEHRILSDKVAARASKLHDAAFADATIKPEDKPSWQDSILAAEEQLAGDRPDENAARADNEK